MTHIKNLTKYTAHFIDELVQSGLTDVVISPGSRSTPLAMMVREHEKMNEWVIIDERSAAFFALGIAKQIKRPVALICTSGTAAANYYPAIIEAYYSRVPLVVLTADRPHELRDIGAPQAIEQMNMYGQYVKWFHEMALPESSEMMLNYVRSKAARAVHVSRAGNAGPVHLNFPFREPLVPDFSIENIWGSDVRHRKSYLPIAEGKKMLEKNEVNNFLTLLTNNEKGLIVCGPQVEGEFAKAVVTFAQEWNLPILADPLSQLRAGNHCKDVIIEGYDAILRNKRVRDSLKPDFIIRFGAMPVSKMYLFYVQENSDVTQYIIEHDEGYRDPTSQSTTFIYADPVHLCQSLTCGHAHSNRNNDWLRKWRQMNDVVKKHLQVESKQHITEGEAVRGLTEVIPENSTLFVGNSMAIRDVDTFFTCTEKHIEILANRGANGIDGVTSSALGAAIKAEKVTLLIGDLSFYHDLNGLLTAKHYDIDITIILINNNGGGIFSFLPQATDQKHFEVLFGTPIHLEFHHAVEMYGGHYEHITHVEELKFALAQSYCKKGISVIEVQTDREENAHWHRNIWQQIEVELLSMFC